MITSEHKAVCLVTGTAGFIGSTLAETLLSLGHDVVGIDCFTDYYSRAIKESNLAKLLSHERFCFLENDLLEIDLVAVLRGNRNHEMTRRSLGPTSAAPIDYIFHLAAQAGVRASWGHSFEIYTRNNILATQRLLEAARQVPARKFVYASSSSIYGDAESYPTTETLTPRPVSPYGVSKLAGEHLCFLYDRNYLVPTAALRYFTVYGPRQRPDMAFHRFIRAIEQGQEIQVYGDGEQTRDFTFVEDAVQGTIAAAFADCSGEAFNLGGGSRVTVNEIIETMESILGKRAKIKYLSEQKGDVRHTSADTSKANATLAYAPKVGLREGLSRESAWLLNAMAAAA
jgi:UDP-glucose 4-epimerase